MNQGSMIQDAGWHLLMPVRGTTASKTRLRPGDTQGSGRRELALAFAADALTAALAGGTAAQISVITGDREAAAFFAGLGVTVIPEAGSGLNAAVRQGLRHVHGSHPGRWRAVLMADLPALTGPDLAAALAMARRFPAAVVPDAAGTGTVLLTAAPGTDPEPCFGTGSFALHRAAGMATLRIPPASTLRRDVDTPEDLAAALALGVGPHTRAVLRAADLRTAA